MKAMVLAAGLGTRLRPLTDDRPKALVEVAGRPMVDWVISRLASHGFTDIIINAHHFAEQIEAYAAGHDHAGVSLTVSVEEEILDTGGGVRKAAWFFDEDEPFLVHNVDVMTDLDLAGLMAAHRASDAQSATGAQSASSALVTVAVKERKSSRHLLFDEEDNLCGWRSDATGETRMVRPNQGEVASVPFMGVCVMSPAVFKQMNESGPFSIIDFFLGLARYGEGVHAFRADAARWADLGSPDRIESGVGLFGKSWFEGLDGSTG